VIKDISSKAKINFCNTFS